jgi:hypothetical protein
MAHRFRGFFARTATVAEAEQLREQASARWAPLSVRRIEEPFVGVGVAMPHLDQLLSDQVEDDVFAVVVEVLFAVAHELPDWTHQLPARTFAYVLVDGPPDIPVYGGYACRAGVVFMHVEPRPLGGGSLKKVFAAIDVDIDESAVPAFLAPERWAPPKE